MIGLFIGSFNPPTLAHLEITHKLAKNFDKIVFVPVNSHDKKLISIQDRIKLLEILTKKYPFLIVDDIMINYSYLNYRIIDLLKKKYIKVKIIVGSDLLDRLLTFENYEYLLQNYSFVVLERENYNALAIIQEKYANYNQKFTVIKFNNNISSTLARKLLQEKKDTKNILDNDVLSYIREHQLY